MFLEHSNSPAFPLIKSCSQTDKFPKNSLHSHISIICEYAHIAFCFPSKVYCSGWQFNNNNNNRGKAECVAHVSMDSLFLFVEIYFK